MGVRSVRSFVLLWVYFFVGVAGAGTVCDLQGCNCTVTVAKWKSVNCSLGDAQELSLDQFRIPPEASEVFISGGQHIILGQGSFESMVALSLLQFEGTRTLVMGKQSFLNLNTPSLLIRIQNCDQLSIKTGAIESSQGTVEVEINRCGSVDVERMAFSRLKMASFKDIPQLTLANGTFEFKHQGNIGRHGPVTTISFDNITTSAILSNTFFSSLAEVKIQKSTIGEIQSNAFPPAQISSFALINSKIEQIESNAFNGRTLILNFKIEKCVIGKIGVGAVSASFNNVNVQHSKIADIQTGAINSTVVNVEISGNQIGKLHSSALVFQSCDKIIFDQNIIQFLDANSIIAPTAQRFSFSGNEVSNFKPGALSFVPQLEDRAFIYKDNFFEQLCHCTLDEWSIELMTVNVTSKVNKIINNTFCRVNELLAQCFELKVEVINMQNFTEMVCNSNNTIICEPYQGETKVVNATNIFPESEPPPATNWLAIIIGTSSVLALIIFTTVIIMLIRGSRWLKRKGYFRKMQYMQNEHSNDEENTIETVDEGDKLDISEDLTIELLQDLSKKLDDPMTHHEACEMIEQLYQKYVHNVGDNNNQDDEAHLYEELGNLQANGGNYDPYKQPNGARSILRMMEERFNTQFEDIDADDEIRPPLVGEYSEPSDAAVHLYSEVKQNKETENENKDSLKSRASSNMAFRPLPDKPGPSNM